MARNFANPKVLVQHMCYLMQGSVHVGCHYNRVVQWSAGCHAPFRSLRTCTYSIFSCHCFFLTSSAGPLTIFPFDSTVTVFNKVDISSQRVLPGMSTKCPGNPIVKTPRGSSYGEYPIGSPDADLHVAMIQFT